MCHEHKCKCQLWDDKFWNGFFQARHPGVFLIVLDLVLTILYTCIYILLAIYIGALSCSHSDAYLILFISNFLIIVIGFLIIHFLTMRPEDFTVLRFAVLYLMQLLAFVLGVTAIAKFNVVPTNPEILEYVLDYFEDHYQVPRVLSGLQTEEKCCGISGITDFLPKSTSVNVTRVPDTCCVTASKKCGDFAERKEGWTASDVIASDKFFQKGCFGTIELQDLNSQSCNQLKLVVYGSYFNILLILGIFIVYTYYVCYKLTQNAEEQPPWAKDEFLDKLPSPFKRIASCRQSQPQLHSASNSGFEKRHSLSRHVGGGSSTMFEGSEYGGSSVESGSDNNISLHKTESSGIEIVRQPALQDVNAAVQEKIFAAQNRFVGELSDPYDDVEATDKTPPPPKSGPNPETDPPKTSAEYKRPITPTISKHSLSRNI